MSMTLLEAGRYFLHYEYYEMSSQVSNAISCHTHGL